MLRKFFKDYFTFTKSERNGILVLVIIIILLIGIRAILPKILNPPDKRTDMTEFEKEIEQFEESLQSDNIVESTSNYQNESVELFYFDPNRATKEEWQRLGIRPAIIRTIENYINNGGRFKRKEDLLKIYGFAQNDYDRLEKFILIEQEKTDTRQYLKEHKGKSTMLISINMTDTSKLMIIKGIGPVLSGRIIKYRDLLGGYIRKEQLLEVYGITEERYKNIAENIIIDTIHIRKININSANVLTLSKHPYLNNYQAKAIVAYREYAGNFREVDELLKNNLLPYEDYRKIKGYLCLE